MTSEILFNWHLHRVCASSRPVLRSIILAMDGGEMLDPALPEVEPHIEQLKACLAEHDIHDVDDFVLCYGLSESNKQKTAS